VAADLRFDLERLQRIDEHVAQPVELCLVLDAHIRIGLVEELEGERLDGGFGDESLLVGAG
jgi:hypothetical protein